MKTDLFQSCGHCWVFQICWHIECSTFTASSFRIWKSSTRIPSPPLTLFVVMLSKAHLDSILKSSLVKGMVFQVVMYGCESWTINKAEVDTFLELSCFFCDPKDVGNLISGSSAFSKSSLNIWKFLVYILLKPGLENFEHYFASVWDECNCVVVWIFFGIAFLWDWNENWPFPVLWLLLSFPHLLAYWV